MTDDPPFNPPVMYNGPPPLPPTPAPQSPSPPTITDLAPRIITSTDKLFLIAYALGEATREWPLVSRVVFNDSISLYPSALQDGRFLVDFYICTLLTSGLMQQTNDIGYNIVRGMAFQTATLMPT